jgi:Mitochondrial carrier protein
MQLSRRARQPGVCAAFPVLVLGRYANAWAQVKPRSFVATGMDIMRRETALALYKGLGAVLGGIVPKMAIRFTSYEYYKQILADKETWQISLKGTFVGRLIVPTGDFQMTLPEANRMNVGFSWSCCWCY